MPVSLLNQPNDISFSYNPIRLEVAASSLWTNSLGTFAIHRLNIPNHLVTVGSTITISWNDMTMLFVAVPTLSGNGAEFLCNPSSGGTSTAPIYYAALASTLGQIYEIANSFNVTPFSGGISFTSLVLTDNLTITTTIPSATVSVITPGSLPSPPPNYKILVDVLVRKPSSPIFIKAARLEKPPLSYAPHSSEFRLEYVLDSAMDIIEPPPSTTSILPYECGLRIFRMVYTERYGAPASAKITQTTAEFRVIKGGVFWENATAQSNFPATGGYIDTNEHFFTNRPRRKKATLGSPEFLCYYHHGASTVGFLQMKVFTAQNPTTGYTVSVPGLTMPITQGELICIPVGYDQNPLLAAAVPANETVIVWTAKLFVSGTTNSKTYIFEAICPQYPRYLVFYNSLGGYDTVCLNAPAMAGVKVQRQEAERFMPYQYPEWQGNYLTNALEATETVKGNTGYVSSEYAQYLPELFRSKFVWEYTVPDPLKRAVNWLPVRILSDGDMHRDGRDSLNSVAVEYEYGWREKR